MTTPKTLERFNPLWSENHRNEASLEISKVCDLANELLCDIDGTPSSLTPNEFIAKTRIIKLHIEAAEMAAMWA